MRFTLSLLAFLFFINLSTSQLDQKIGEWKSFLPYNDGRWVTQSKDKIYYATELSLFSINKEDVNDYMFLSKIDGLTDVGIKRIKYNDLKEQLIVVYDNSNIDIIGNDEIINIADVKNNQILTGDRSINDIHIQNENQVFFATVFGVIELNLEKLEFTSTVFTNLAVNDITSNGNILYAATDDGIYSVDIVANNNIADFSSWTLLDNQVGFPIVYSCGHIEVFNNRLYANIENDLYFEGDNGQFTDLPLTGYENYDIKFLAPGQSRLIVGVQTGITARAIFIDENNGQRVHNSSCANIIRYAVEDEQGRIWYADGFTNIRWAESDTSPCMFTKINSPSQAEVTDIAVEDGILYAASGGVKDNYTPLANRNGFYILRDGTWTNYRKETIPATDTLEFINNFQIEPHPSDDRIYVASYYEGLLEFDPNTEIATVYKENNSPISGTVGDPNRERISGLAFDNNEVLWINNFGAVTPLIAYTPEGNFHAFNPSGDNQLAKVVVDQNGYTWSVLISAAGGIVVHNSNGTLADPSDDQSVFINTSNSELQTGTVNTVGVDLDGEVWVGTNEGPVIFDSSPALFEGGNLGSRRKVLQDSIAAFLLETEDIRAIAFDGGNRKWFGSRNGIFVQSPDGETLELQFNVDNSPLFDNVINAFEYDGDTGIMYISTNKGMQSYRTETLGSTKNHANQVFAYPNPVRPEYIGPIAIKGLARDANIKITDLNGKLVYEATALGGQAIWDGKDYTGRKAASGVYFVFSTGTASFDTPDSFVTKIMIVK
ncbi:MAG: ligand-binding sensor domain-containing protein [Saprospiraceae bacterium]|jgi:ligand-binding sensor domain-containing protein